jgi:hypothetical protein
MMRVENTYNEAKVASSSTGALGAGGQREHDLVGLNRVGGLK